MKSAILATIHSDAHSWNLIYFQLLLEEMGFAVENLGVCTPPQLVAQQLRNQRPELVVISTVNGHGYLEGIALGETLRSVNETSLLVIGGKLSTNGICTKAQEASLLGAGFHKVFHQQTSIDDFRAFLETHDVYQEVSGL